MINDVWCNEGWNGVLDLESRFWFIFSCAWILVSMLWIRIGVQGGRVFHFGRIILVAIFGLGLTCVCLIPMGPAVILTVILIVYLINVIVDMYIQRMKGRAATFTNDTLLAKHSNNHEQPDYHKLYMKLNLEMQEKDKHIRNLQKKIQNLEKQKETEMQPVCA